MVQQYLKYLLKAKGIQQIHSPFLYEFYQQVIRFRGNDETRRIHELVRKMAETDAYVEVTDFGTGNTKPARRRIRDIVSRASTNKRWGNFLYALATRTNGTILELGTNLGIGTSYLATGSTGRVVSLEGCRNLSAQARRFLNEQGLTRVELLTGRIQDVLPAKMSSIGVPGLIYLDADHTYEATISFFEIFKAMVDQETVLVMDDIHWSREMESAWEQIVSDGSVTLSIDLFHKGVIFFDKRLSKQHMILK